jgi:hypothetical protein
MSILNRPSDGLLSVLLALRSALLAYGSQETSALLDLVAPSSVVPDGKPDMARKTLTRWTQLGLFTETDRVISLSSSARSIGADDLDGLRAVVLRLVLAPENNPGLLVEGGDDQEGSKASDCTRAMAWVLAQDPYGFPTVYSGGVESLQHEQEVRPKAFVNDTRWVGFAEWAVFVGVAWSAPKSDFVPCPAFAVRSVLADVFSDKTELAQAEFFTRLAECLPVVDGGRYRAVVEGQTARPWRNQSANEISPSLSAALVALEAAGTLRLEVRSDAPTRMLLGRAGRELHSISHLVRVGVA